MSEPTTKRAGQDWKFVATTEFSHELPERFLDHCVFTEKIDGSNGAIFPDKGLCRRYDRTFKPGVRKSADEEWTPADFKDAPTGWFETSPIDKFGHWIGYVPVPKPSQALPIDNDKPWRHTYLDEDTIGVLEWNGSEWLTKTLCLSEVTEPFSVELVGPLVQNGDTVYKLPDTTASYKCPDPMCKKKANLQHYVLRHGQITLEVPVNASMSGETVFATLKEWLTEHPMEGLVLHGKDEFTGQMFKVTREHLGLPPLTCYRD